MILQFNLHGLKRQPNESSLSKTTALLEHHFEVRDQFAPFLLQDSGNYDNERIQLIGDATMINFQLFWISPNST